jgi:TolB-like protein
MRASQPVTLSPRAFSALVYFVSHPGLLISETELIENVWPGWNVEDVTLEATISDLRLAIERDGMFIEAVPNQGYRFMSNTTDQSASPSPFSRFPWRWRIAAVLGIALASFAYGALRPRDPLQIRSLAVLPFRLTGMAGDETLQLGLADTLIGRLKRFQQLKVRSMDTVRRYADGTHDPVKAGRQMRVDAVLEGVVERDGSNLRVNLRLLTPHDGDDVWTDSVEGPADKLFSLQDAIAERVASAVQLELPAETKAYLTHRATRNPEAHRAYLQARHLFSQRSARSFVTAIHMLEKAVGLDPKYAEAHSTLAETLLISSGYDHVARPDALERVRYHSARAIDLDRTLGAPHRVLAMLAENYDYDRGEAERRYQSAIALSPNDSASHHYYAGLLGSMGRFDEAEEEMQVADTLDPLSPILQTDWAKIALLARRFDIAIKRATRVLEIDPNFEQAHGMLAWAYQHRGDYGNALESANARNRLIEKPDSAFTVAVLAKSGRGGEARKLVEEIERAGSISPIRLSRIYAQLGDPDRAIELLQQQFSAHTAPGLIGLETDPDFDELRSDPRFRALLKQLGAVEPDVVTQSAALNKQTRARPKE